MAVGGFWFSGETFKTEDYVSSIEAGKVYQGYPCRDECEAFTAGYDGAKEAEIDGKPDCQKFDGAERLGCEAFVNDYKIGYLNIDDLSF